MKCARDLGRKLVRLAVSSFQVVRSEASRTRQTRGSGFGGEASRSGAEGREPLQARTSTSGLSEAERLGTKFRPDVLAPTLALVTVLSGCASVFGIDDPTACPNGVCLLPDAGPTSIVDATLPDSAPPIDATVGIDSEGDAPTDGGPVDASSDQAPPTGIRCGSGSLRCSGATPSCCETPGDGGSSYSCVVSHGACTDAAGYWIQCTSPSDCNPGTCCYYNSSMKCEPTCSSTSILACDPTVDGSCPPGKSCNVDAPSAGPGYYLCSP
jgi:hypothetical protein